MCCYTVDQPATPVAPSLLKFMQHSLILGTLSEPLPTLHVLCGVAAGRTNRSKAAFFQGGGVPKGGVHEFMLSGDVQVLRIAQGVVCMPKW